MKRLLALSLAVVALAIAAAPAGAAESSWGSQQPPVGPGGVPTPIGPVGDIECWAANRCVLITGGIKGNSSLPAGIYAYDGAGWHLYSTVCGGGEGRIAWAGPTEFWTVSDQQVGQEVIGDIPKSISLCHFKDGAVVASFGQPVGFADSYKKMSAAVCLVPEECWFGGERLPGTVNVGAFHLYWNGFSLLDVPSLTEQEPALEDPGRSVFDLAYHGGALYESVVVDDDDEAPEEPAEQPYFLHRVLPGSPSAFESIVADEPLEYGGPGVGPDQLGGFHLGDDGEGLWAVSGSTAKGNAEITTLRLTAGEVEQLALLEEAPTFGAGDEVVGLGAEPGAAAAWIGFIPDGETAGLDPPARLARVHADGTVEAPVALPPAGEGVGNHGQTGPIECAAAGQCWMATTQGWLFHLGADPPLDTDPALHTLITTRPADPSLPTPPPAALPFDDSGLFDGEAEEVPLGEEDLRIRRKPALVSKLRQKLIKGRVLQLSFVLRKRSKVRLIASRKGRVVAKTEQYTLGKGPRRLRLRLNPKRWPTKLDLRVHEVKNTGGSS